ncbi:MAG: Gfo/Idh/MocA family protein [Solirubrobacteraceae bacterium]
MIKVGLVGLGKMGLSHYAIFNTHPDVKVVGLCDSSSFLLDVLHKYTGVATFSRADELIDGAKPESLVISTPTGSHAALVRDALSRNIDVFCEKPLALTAEESAELSDLANERRLVTQVGYHNRFLATFAEVRRLLDAGAVGTVTHAMAEAYGPVVLKPPGSTWRKDRSQGGGALYDYAAHAVNLLTWYMGAPDRVAGTSLGQVFSRQTEDQVASTLFFESGATAQLSVNWSDESARKMSTRVTIWGTNGKLYVDRQECQAYLRNPVAGRDEYRPGWNVRYTTDLTPPVWYYLRGEEYSGQVDGFIKAVMSRDTSGPNSFGAAVSTDRVIAMMSADARGERVGAAVAPVRRRRPRWFKRARYRALRPTSPSRSLGR